MSAPAAASADPEAARGGIGKAPSDAPFIKVTSDVPFIVALSLLGGVYVFLIVAMLVADLAFTTRGNLTEALNSPEIRYSIRLSLLSCSMTTIFALWSAVPLGYLLSRFEFRGKHLIEAVVDIPIVLPPLVVGLSLLVLFQTPVGRWLNETLPGGVTYAIPSVILAQYMVATAFAVRTMRATFDQINPRQEQVALTLGCSRGQAFWRVALPESRRGLVTAATLAWARSLGEFGPILIFSGATRMKTEVLPTTVYLEMNAGNIGGAVAVSLIMIAVALAVLVLMRAYGFGVKGEPAR